MSAEAATVPTSEVLELADQAPTADFVPHDAPLAILIQETRDDRERKPDAFIDHMTMASKRTEASDQRTRRRHAFALLKAYPQEYWAFNHYVRLVAPDRWRFRLIERLLELHPGLFGMTAHLLLTAKDPAATPDSLKAAIIARGEEAVMWSGWEAVLVAQALLTCGRPDLASTAARGACQADTDEAIRFEALLTLSRTAPPGPEGAYERVRCLVTALRVFPDHVTVAGLLQSIAADLKELDLTQSTDAADFAERCHEILTRDGVIDIADTAQVRLQLGGFLRPEERAKSNASSQVPLYDRVIDRALCTIRRGVDVARPEPGSDAWMIATTTPDVVAVRQAVYRTRLEQVSFYASTLASLYIDSAGSVVKLLSSGHSSSFGPAFLQRHEAAPLRGHFVDLTLAFGHFNYSHFLLDRIPRLIFADTGEDRTAALMVDEDSVGWTRDILEIMGDTRQVIPIALGRVYHIDSVTAFSRAQHPAQCGFSGYSSFFRSLTPPLAGPASRRIVVHRKQGRRGIRNETEFYATLTERGFDIVRLETMSLREQIALFSQASFIVGVHGAGFANIVFSPPGAKLIEIMPVGYRMPGYVILASQLGHEYLGYTEYSETNLRLATADQFSDTDIDIERWLRFLESSLHA